MSLVEYLGCRNVFPTLSFSRLNFILPLVHLHVPVRAREGCDIMGTSVTGETALDH